MPGLSQLKQFNKDILSLGDEIQLRAQRGEKPVRVSIPKSIEDIDDSEEFVMGMPEKEAVVQNTSVDDDLSELQNLTAKNTDSQSDKKEETPDTGFETPDLSALLAPMEDDSASASGTEDMPDLSMFMEPEEQPVEEEEKEPEETSIADLGLEALLGGAGFDGSSNPAMNEVISSSETDDEDEEFYSGGFGDDNYTPQKKEKKAPSTKPTADIFSDLAAMDTPAPSKEGDALSLDELGLGDSSEPEDLTTLETLSGNDFSTDDFSSDIMELEGLEELEADTPSDFSAAGSQETLSDISAFDESVLDLNDSTDSQGSGMDFSNPPELTEGFGSDFGAAQGLDSLDSFDIPEMDSAMDAEPVEAAGLTEDFSFDAPESLSGDDNFNIPDMDESSFEAPASDDNAFSLPDMDAADQGGDLPPQDEESSPVIDFGAFDFDNLEAGNDSTADSGMEDFGDFSFDTPSGTAAEPTEEISDTGDFGSDFGMDSFDSGSSESGEEDLPIETFDISEMEGMDFNIPETDAQLDTPETSTADDAFDGSDFEIPGFSDVQTAKEEKYTPILGKADAGGKKKGEELPPNTLSDEQYKVFLKNLADYPLNVRLAFEDLIVKNEFTDDAEFEIIEKILNKAPARQVATLLEKMLDISIPVPRDFEHRTAEEYAAYKKSLQYQLKNKIIPAVFAGMVILVVGFGLFQFGKNVIYYPAMASHLYKQGYAMLQADEYPQSKEKFYSATKYQKKKKWYFKYARGYREKKQYLSAEEIYKNILRDFKNDKEAGIEYARMNLDDLANYEKAEDICLHEVLYNHVNDEDGILLLGDVYLEWGTEKDPAKLEAAKEQYTKLMQLYKNQNLYLSRLMRYYIRTDNLPEVLRLKERFLPKEKNLIAEDWTELSGYLLDKLYGPLPTAYEYLRDRIEDVKLLLSRSVNMDPASPIAYYNLSRYYIQTNEAQAAKDSLKRTIDNFNRTDIIRRRDMYKFINSYRLSGEEYFKANEYMRAQEFYTDGISLFTKERDSSGLAGTPEVGKLYEDQGNIDYFVSGDYDNALQNFVYSVELENDSPSIRYKIGYIQYKKSNYAEAFGSFMKAGDGSNKEPNLLLAMGNTLSLRGDNYPAQGYYSKLVDKLEQEISKKGTDLVQGASGFEDLVTLYLYATNNYGVTLHRLAQRTGSSEYNAESIVQLSQALRAWDALTRNPETMVSLGGSNLPKENIRYISYPVPDFKPSIFTEIPKTIDSEKF